MVVSRHQVIMLVRLSVGLEQVMVLVWLGMEPDQGIGIETFRLI